MMKRIFEKDKLYANPLKRFGSFIIDFILIYVLFVLVLNVLIYFGYDFYPFVEKSVLENNIIQIKREIDNTKLQKIQYFFYIINYLYYTFFLSLKKQATIGQQFFKIMVVHRKEVKMSFLSILFRYVYFVLNIQIYLLGFMTYFWRKDGAFLHDILSDTITINLKK